jgi:CRP-like cAMP-binding protein
MMKQIMKSSIMSDDLYDQPDVVEHTPLRHRSCNALLEDLPEDERRLVEPDLQSAILRPNERLVEREKVIGQVYFLDEGWASVMSAGSMRPVEVAMIGPEGMVGLSVFLGATVAVNNCLMQTNGKGRRLATSCFQRIVPQMPVFRQRILSYIHERLLESYNAVIATTVGALEARVARAILMCHDRSPGDEITITQDQLARKIGANRAGVTNVLHLLEGQRVITSRRRCVLVIDRLRLEKVAAGSYTRGVPH